MINKKRFPIKRKHKHLKRLVLLSFCLGGMFFVGEKNINLPYDNNQDIPDTDDNSQKIDKEALDAYQILLENIYAKSSLLGVNLSDDYLIKIVAYNNMTDSIDVIMQNSNKTAHLNFSAENISNGEITLNSTVLADQISSLNMILDVPLLTIPQITSMPAGLEDTINTNMSSSVNEYACTEQQISYGDERIDTANNNLINGRDYYFVDVFGTTSIDNTKYNVITNIAVKTDDYEIDGIENLVDYYIQNPTYENFVINQNYQENLGIFESLNSYINQNELSMEH